MSPGEAAGPAGRADRQPLTLRVLGALELRRGEEPVALPRSRKTRALLAYLALTGRPHGRTRLSALLWGQVNDERAGLRWSLSRLRPLLDDGDLVRLRADRDSVGLDVSRLSIDLETCRQAARPEAALPVAALVAAADGFSGEFLEDLDLPDCPDYQAWLIAMRHEARLLHALVLDRLIAHLAGDPEAALRYARQRVALDRSAEGPHIQLIQLFHATGREREAEDHLKAHREWLADQGLGPARRLEQAALELRGAAPVAAHHADEVAPGRPAGAGGLPSQTIRFTKTDDGVRIAYATAGDGPPLLKPATWLSHLEHDWNHPVWRHWLRELSRDHQLVRYDARGNGLSDWDVPEISFEAFVRDLATVGDVAGLGRCPLVGISQGVPLAIAYAVWHPDKVSRLVLVGGFARGWRVRGRQREIELVEAMMALAAQGWGKDHPVFRQSFTTLFFPHGSSELMRAFDALQRRTARADNVVRTLRALGDIDVTSLLGQVQVPTLVAHSRHDSLIPFGESRVIAAGIRGARFLQLDSENHLLLEDEPAWPVFLKELRAFLEEPDPAADPDPGLSRA